MDSVSEWLDEFCEKRSFSTAFLKKIVDTEESDEGILSLFEYMGGIFSLRRILFFEYRDGRHTPAYTWGAEGTKPYQRPEEELVRETLALLNDSLMNGRHVLFQDTQAFASRHPLASRCFASLDLPSLAAVPLFKNGDPMGFIVSDVPDWNDAHDITAALYLAGRFVARIFRMRDILRSAGGVAAEIDADADKGALSTFLRENFFDFPSFLDSIELADQYVYFGDLQSNLFYINDQARDAFGFESNIIKNLLAEWEKHIRHPDDLVAYHASLANLLEDKRTIHDLRYRVTDRTGNEFWVRCSGILKWDPSHEKPLFISGSVTRLATEFVIDPTTGFAREKGAEIKLQEMQKAHSAFSLIGFRLNNFREINEMHGRSLSDALLKGIAAGLTNRFRDSLLIYRLDGLRFLAILPPDIAEDPKTILDFISQTVRDLYANHGLAVQAPSSLALMEDIPSDTPTAEIIANMLSLLDLAKETLDEPYVVFSPQNIETRKNLSRFLLAINEDVERGCANFRTVIQPTVAADGFGIVSGELLCRWSHEGTNISPGVFIPILERSQQIRAVGRWVFEQAVIHAKRIHRTNPDFSLNFNVSYHQVLDPEFLPFMRETLDRHEMEGKHLVAELTETNYNESPATLQTFIETCRELGIRLALDDFGTGYSSLELLLKHPSDIVKLDRSLMKEMAYSKNSSDFISSIVYPCHKFGKKVCVEGVETEQELQTVIEAGCDYIQGFYFHRPMEIPDFFRMMEAKSSLN
ncbi:EAL domain-containing protein [uncultured Selenomonas sp.]|uniref:EAL domain-containing protein n=1 Tax=uncultured Selenomonas sp. TaxID=159275 RepID=UPI0028DC1632|nr:EAL domain-containing protein [uncultured Selenomonas sp.]